MQTYNDADTFLMGTQPFFETRETENHSIFSTALWLRDRAEAAKPYLATFEGSEGLTLAAVMAPGQNLLLSGKMDVSQAALDELCADLRAHDRAVPGITAPDELARRFAETWQRASGPAYRLHLHMRAYEVRKVIFPTHPAAGSLRPAAPGDLDFLVAWRAAFQVESLGEQPPRNLREIVARQVEAGHVYLWEDNGPVSTAAITRPTSRGIWIHAVYTPPEFRGRGYASVSVAELSQKMLDTGKAYVGLYTVVDYPTSNAIYQHIGYHPVCDFMVLQFV